MVTPISRFSTITPASKSQIFSLGIEKFFFVSVPFHLAIVKYNLNNFRFPRKKKHIFQDIAFVTSIFFSGSGLSAVVRGSFGVRSVKIFVNCFRQCFSLIFFVKFFVNFSLIVLTNFHGSLSFV